FQAEDGIRDFHVTGVQTCALPISTADTHFAVRGPVVLQLISVFAHDWRFTTKETLPYDVWCADTWEAPEPQVPARCIRSGPDRRSEERRVEKECRSRGATSPE